MSKYTPDQMRHFQELELKHCHLSSRNPVLAAQFLAQSLSAILEARSMFYGAGAVAQPIAREPAPGDLAPSPRISELLGVLRNAAEGERDPNAPKDLWPLNSARS